MPRSDPSDQTVKSNEQPHDAMKAIRDDDLTFFLSVYRDYLLARQCLERLRLHYPTARLIVVSDGDSDRRHQRLAQRLSAEFHSGERLFLVERGGAVIQRMLAGGASKEQIAADANKNQA